LGSSFFWIRGGGSFHAADGRELTSSILLASTPRDVTTESYCAGRAVPHAPHVADVMSFSSVHAEHFQLDGATAAGVAAEAEEEEEEEEEEDNDEPFLGTSQTTHTVELVRFSA
jgi:hypothetical protein